MTVKISDRNKMDPDAKEREVTIAGTYGAVKLAEAMIAEKLNQSRARASTREGGGGRDNQGASGADEDNA